MIILFTSPSINSTLNTTMKHTILCVDDEIHNVDVLERVFRRDYHVLKATSGMEALNLLKKNPQISIILSDQRMPEMTGVEMLEQSMQSHPDAIRILLTGHADIDSVIDAINRGHVYRYIGKPWDSVDLKNTIDKAGEKFSLRKELLIKNKELKQALDELKTLDQAKDNFMILINHELKTPLTTLISFLGLLKESSLNDEQVSFIKHIDKSAQKLKSIINDVLTLVSSETGLTKLNKEAIGTQELFKDIELPLLEKAKKRNQKINLDIEQGEALVDAKQLRDITQRLLDNAIKFGNQNSDIEFKVTTNNNALNVCLSNEGNPLSEETIKKVLKPFQLDENIMNHSTGLGLGLSLAQAVLKQHNSQLEICCSRGKVQVSFTI